MTQYSKHVEICVEISTITKENKQRSTMTNNTTNFTMKNTTIHCLNRKTITNINTYEPNRMLELMLSSPKYKTATKMTLPPTINPEYKTTKNMTLLPTKSPKYKTATNMTLLLTNTPPLFLPMKSQLWQQPEVSSGNISR